MKHKKATLAISAAVAGAAVLGGIHYAAGKRKPKSERNPVSRGKGQAEEEAAVQEEELTEEKVRECLLWLFRLYEDMEFDELAEFLDDSGDALREYAADNYSDKLFPYIKKGMKDVMMLEGDDGTGKELFSMTDALFSCPACMIGCEIKELFSDNFGLCLESEMWMLENGQLASVYCVSIGKDGGRLSYRFLDTYIRNPGDIPICFSCLESGFAEIIRAGEEGREPELP